MEQQILTIDTAAGINVKESVEPLSIYTDKHPLMRTVIPHFDELLPDKKISNIVERLINTRNSVGGVGIAANQCGLPMRLFVIGTGDFDMVCINPEILEEVDPPVSYKEGCLSFPGLFLKIKRPDGIKVRYTNLEGEVIEEVIHGMTARCFQHELDHLNGIVMTDHVGSMKMHLAKKKQKKVIRAIKQREMYRG